MKLNRHDLTLVKLSAVIIVLLLHFGCDKLPRSNEDTGTITDYDGNTYNTVKIGNQWWMAENLRTTHYANGKEIQLVGNTNDWSILKDTTIAMCYYDNLLTNGNTYGGLYNWSAAMNGANASNTNPSNVQGVCPTGWHLPSEAEWNELTNFLGGASVAGGKMKGTGILHWDSPNSGATNESGFLALPGGRRNDNGIFTELGYSGGFWNATEDDATHVVYHFLYYRTSAVNRGRHYKNFAYSVRCVKD